MNGIWREKRLLLAILGVLLIANVIFFFTYRVQYQTRLQDLTDKRDQASARLAQEHSQRIAAERRVASFRKISADVKDIYDNQWSTEGQRLTALITEVKRLAVASELVPKSISYNRAGATGEAKKAKTAAETVTISFTVSGTYQQVRRLINLLELSQQFVIIDQVALSAADNQNLTLTLQLKTLFRDTTPAAAKQL